VFQEVNRVLTLWNKLILIALVNFVSTFVLNPTATDGCVSPRTYLNSSVLMAGLFTALD
jgi:hypothetical protein